VASFGESVKGGGRRVFGWLFMADIVATIENLRKWKIKAVMNV
jgi:hypothetical protein